MKTDLNISAWGRPVCEIEKKKNKEKLLKRK